jgi:hypothetical protein
MKTDVDYTALAVFLVCFYPGDGYGSAALRRSRASMSGVWVAASSDPRLRGSWSAVTSIRHAPAVPAQHIFGMLPVIGSPERELFHQFAIAVRVRVGRVGNERK